MIEFKLEIEYIFSVANARHECECEFDAISAEDLGLSRPKRHVPHRHSLTFNTLGTTTDNDVEDSNFSCFPLAHSASHSQLSHRAHAD